VEDSAHSESAAAATGLKIIEIFTFKISQRTSTHQTKILNKLIHQIDMH